MHVWTMDMGMLRWACFYAHCLGAIPLSDDAMMDDVHGGLCLPMARARAQAAKALELWQFQDLRVFFRGATASDTAVTEPAGSSAASVLERAP